MHEAPTGESLYLRALARRIVAPYVALPGARAAMLSGSAAEGLSDQFSDIDMTVYYDALPDEAAITAARVQNGGSERLWLLGDRDEGSFAESYDVHGVECQIGHATIAAWEQSIGMVLDDLDVESPLQKALEGTLNGIPLYGDSLIEGWKARVAAYPDRLAHTMVEHFLRFTPLWLLQDRLLSRDSTLWRTQILVESSHHLLAVLAGINRVYFSSFQFKRARRFADRLAIRPDRFADRLEYLFHAEPRAAIAEIERLIAETVDLVEQHMPSIDTSRVRSRLGQRPTPWQPVPLDGIEPGDVPSRGPSLEGFTANKEHAMDIQLDPSFDALDANERQVIVNAAMEYVRSKQQAAPEAVAPMNGGRRGDEQVAAPIDAIKLIDTQTDQRTTTYSVEVSYGGTLDPISVVIDDAGNVAVQSPE